MKNQTLFSSKDKSKKLKCCLLQFFFGARQRIHMKTQALFSSEDKSKKLRCHLVQFLFGTLRVNNLPVSS